MSTEEKFNDFLTWVEGTSLFHAIKNDPDGVEIKSSDGSISINLNRTTRIEKAIDLPKEILLEFYKNSPQYSPGSETFKSLIES